MSTVNVTAGFDSLNRLMDEMDRDMACAEITAEREPPAPSRDTREHLHGDDNICTYRNAYDLPFVQIEMNAVTRAEMYKLNYNAHTYLRAAAPSFWLELPDYKNLAHWFTNTFKPSFDALLARYPGGLFIKDMAMSPKDVLTKDLSEEAYNRALAEARRRYPHMKPDEIDGETYSLLITRAFFRLSAIKDAGKAMEYVLRSKRVAATLNAAEAYNQPYSLWLRPFDSTIAPASEKRMAVLKKVANSPDTSAKIMALTSYTTVRKRTEKPALPATDYYPQMVLKMAQEYVSKRERELIPSSETAQTVVDLCLAFNTNVFAVQCHLMPRTEGHPIKFIERNPYDLMPSEECLGAKEAEYITDIFEFYAAERAKECSSSELLARVGTLKDELKAFLPPGSTTDINRFNWYTDRAQLYDKSKNPEVRVDLADYYADYTLGCDERRQVPTTYEQFHELYFAQPNHKTEQDELRFFQTVYAQEALNDQRAIEAQSQLLALRMGPVQAVVRPAAETVVAWGAEAPSAAMPSFATDTPAFAEITLTGTSGAVAESANL